MAQFQELIKNFDRIRDYMRQFYVYGFKVRGEFTEKSARTYDNERRRIESWLSGCISSDYTAKGKQDLHQRRQPFHLLQSPLQRVEIKELYRQRAAAALFYSALPAFAQGRCERAGKRPDREPCFRFFLLPGNDGWRAGGSDFRRFRLPLRRADRPPEIKGI